MNNENFKNEIENINIKNDFEKSFLRYAMSVITARAIPDARDGLKPVNRRIIYAMNGLGLTHDKAFKKSARVVGEVIGKYHPHGEQSIYGSLVHLSQDFSMNHPLVKGHGNFGSIDGDQPAAQRYTEVKLSKISSLLSMDLNKDTVDFISNYDDTEKEPTVLPAYFPNLLVNGTFGIAVGMSTKIPPHNLIEISKAIIEIVKNPNITDKDLSNIIIGPDFPTGGIIYGDSGIKQAYSNGFGKYILKSKYHIEEKKGIKSIIITEIPFNVKKSEIIVKLGSLSREKVIREILDLKDESSHGKIRLKITLKKNVNIPVFMNKLFKKTDLQKKEDINILALVKSRPKLLTLRQTLDIYIEHQKDVITRKTRYELKKAEERLHILQGLLIALNNIDEIIKIIKEAENPIEAKPKLMLKFNLSEIQSKSILEMQLQRLTNLEVEKIKNEHDSLTHKIADYKDILSNKARVMDIIIKQQEDNIVKYGKKRKTEIVKGAVLDLTDEELMEDEDVYVAVSKKGYLKRLDYTTFRTQKKGGKGISGIGLYDDDLAKWLITTSTKSKVLFITSIGKIYSLKAYELPLSTRTAKGTPVSYLIDELRRSKEKLSHVLTTSENQKIDSFIFITKKGYIKKVDSSNFERINISGKRAIALNEDDEVVGVHLVKDEKEIILASSNNKLVRFSIDELNTLGRYARGVKAMNLPNNSYIVSSEVVFPSDLIVLVFNNARGKRVKVSDIRKVKRKSKGVLAVRKEEGVRIIKILKANDNNSLLLTTVKGLVININIAEIRVLSRGASGVTIIRLSKNDRIVDAIVKEETTSIPENTSKGKLADVSHETSDNTIEK